MTSCKKIFFLLFLVLITFLSSACNLRFFYKEPTRKLSDTVIKPKLDKNKIALVGFYDFHTEYKRYGRLERYPINLSYLAPFREHFEKIGTPLEELKAGGKSTPPAKAQEFVDDFLRFTGPTGQREMENLFVFENEKVTALKITGIEHYIVGTFAPQISINKRNHYMGGIGQVLSTLANFVSLGIIPIWQDYYTDNRIQVYDKNFNLVFDKNITKNTHFIATWWLSSNDVDEKGSNEGRNDRSKMISKHARKIIYGADLQDLYLDYLDWQAMEAK